MSCSRKAPDASAFESIPIIDLEGAFNQDEAVRRALAQQIRMVYMNVGFFYVKNHGISQDCLDQVLKVNKEYYLLSADEKMKLHHKTVPNFKGYSRPMDANIQPGNRGDLHEGFRIGWEEKSEDPRIQSASRDGVMAGANVWPDQPANFRLACLDYYHATLTVGKKLFGLFAMALDLPETYFDDKTMYSAANMRTLHYPPQPDALDDKVLGIGAHTDFTCFTILWQQAGIQALQVLNSHQQWIDVPPLPGTLVINLGDQFARWTNDVFKSTVHRACNRNAVDRYSIAMFFGTDYEVNIEPIYTCVSSENPAKYPAITAGEYVRQRLKAMYNSS
ncbi:Clavaminate synthase-like protein [Rhizopogon salebrosus TDB-379]|nr:Clavaminate synthase-like protein [Rhizopogon salebrosus TDB-379]